MYLIIKNNESDLPFLLWSGNNYWSQQIWKTGQSYSPPFGGILSWKIQQTILKMKNEGVQIVPADKTEHLKKIIKDSIFEKVKK